MESTKIEIGSSFGLVGFEKPDTSPPDYITLKKFKLIYFDGEPMIPTYCGISIVFAKQISKDEPVYAIFAAGTNRLVILEKTPCNDWKQINLNEIKDLNGLICRMCGNINQIKYKLKELTKM